MKHSLDDYLDNNCTRTEFIAQYNPIQLEVGKTYVQAKGTSHERHFKILFIDNKIAVGVSVWSKIGNGDKKYCGDYKMFYVDNGFSYQDICRPIYRLSEES